MIESADLQNVIVDGLPLGAFLTNMRLSLLIETLLPEGCHDRKKFEDDFTSMMQGVMASVEQSKMKQQLSGGLAVVGGVVTPTTGLGSSSMSQMPDAPPSGLIVP